MPELRQSDESTHSLIDVDSPHISSVPSDFDQQSIKTDTQASRIEREDETKRLLDEASENAKLRKNKSKKAASKIKEDPEALYKVANGVIGAVAAAAIGWGAYQKHLKGELTWKVVGLWTGVLAAFGAGDYFLGQYLVNKQKK